MRNCEAIRPYFFLKFFFAKEPKIAPCTCSTNKDKKDMKFMNMQLGNLSNPRRSIYLIGTKYTITANGREPLAGILEREVNASELTMVCGSSEYEATLRRQLPLLSLGVPCTGFPSHACNRTDLHVLEEVQGEKGIVKKDEKEKGFRAVWL
jgi:hypothetical protein